MPTPPWALDLASWLPGDEALPEDLEGINVVLNRARLANFLAEFAEDKDVRDLLALDLITSAAGFSVTSTGVAETEPSLPFRPFRLWEYAWLYKTLRLSSGGLRVLDLGGPSTPLSILAALAGNRVTSLDINPDVVRSAEEFARCCQLGAFQAHVGDMRDLSKLPADGFDVIVCCSVLEHLTAQDQETALQEMARVLAPGGVVGLTFDYGPAAPGANRYLPPPHDPPDTAAEVMRRYYKGGLIAVGNPFSEDSVPGVLFHDLEVRYTVASLFLAKPPALAMSVPRCERKGSALGGLVIERLPLRIYQSATQSNAELCILRNELDQMQRARAAEVGQLQRLLDEQQARAALLEAAAAERLVGMEEKDAAMAQFRAEFERVVEEQRARANLLEAAAAERLAGMEEKDRAMARLRADFEHAIKEQQSRADLLETAAVERLAGMEERDVALAQLRSEFERR
jgi:SAM-dependent methyltransferase